MYDIYCHMKIIRVNLSNNRLSQSNTRVKQFVKPSST